jgi:pyocin large subunit-like protein
MSSDSRRPRAGLPLAILLAIIAAIFGGRFTSRQPAPATVPTSSASPTAAGARTAPTAPTTPAARRGSLGFTTHAHLVEHFGKHGAEFPGLTIDTYLEAAQTLRDRPVGGAILEVRRSDGVITRFDRQSGAFLAANRDGTIRTFFRPNDGEAYFRRQAARAPGGGP